MIKLITPAHLCLLNSGILASLFIATTSSLAAATGVTWADFTPADGQSTDSSTATTVSIAGSGSFSFVSTSTSTFNSTIQNLVTHGETELGLGDYNNDLSVVSHFAGGATTEIVDTIRTDTLTFSNFAGFSDTDMGLLYIEGISNRPSASGVADPTPMTISVTGGSPAVLTWSQVGSFAPRGNNDIDPVFSAVAGTLTASDSGAVGLGDASGIFLNIGLLKDYDTLTVQFETPNGDGYLVGVGVAVPEPSSTALLGLGGLALMLRRRK